MEIKMLSKKDYGKDINFAIRGIHLDWYIKNKMILRLYGRYFLYLELNDNANKEMVGELNEIKNNYSILQK